MFETKIKPRISETDGAGHINNTVIPIWFEAGRNEFFQIFTPDFSFDNWKLVIANVTIDYKKQMYYGRDVTVKSWVKKLGNTSIVLYEEIYQDQLICAISQTTYVNFNFTTNKSETIPTDIRSELEKHLFE